MDHDERAKIIFDLLLKPTALSNPQERVLACDLLISFLPHLSQGTLRLLIERVSGLSPAPENLLRALFELGDDALSSLLLTQDKDIPDGIMTEVLRTNPYLYAPILAKKRFLSETVTTPLVAHEDRVEGLELLIRNLGARFSQPTFARLLEKVRLSPALHAPFVNRQDLPAHLAFSLFWSVSGDLRRYIITRFLGDFGNMSQILPSFISPKPERLIIGGDHQRVWFTAEASTAPPWVGLAEVLGVSSRTAQRIFGDSGGEPLMVALKALECSRSACEALLDLFKAIPALQETGEKKEILCHFFHSLSYSKARVLLLYWEWEVLACGPYMPMPLGAGALGKESDTQPTARQAS